MVPKVYIVNVWSDPSWLNTFPFIRLLHRQLGSWAELAVKKMATSLHSVMFWKVLKVSLFLFHIQIKNMLLMLFLINYCQTMSLFCKNNTRFEPIPNVQVSGNCKWEMRRNTDSNRIPPTIMEMNCLNPDTECSGNQLFHVNIFVLKMIFNIK